MTRSIAAFVALCTFAMILGCRHTSYAGDGHFVDNGLFAYSRRYVLDLGPVDLERTGAQAYRLAKLPNAEFTIGIELVEARPNGLTDARPDHRGRVRVELKTSQGETVILQDAPLEEWVWMHASGDTTSRLYRRGESTEIPLGDGTSRTVAVGEGPSGGWGTYFYSSSSEVYALKIDVLEPLKVTGRPVRLVLVGWGRA